MYYFILANADMGKKKGAHNSNGCQTCQSRGTVQRPLYTVAAPPPPPRHSECMSDDIQSLQALDSPLPSISVPHMLLPHLTKLPLPTPPALPAIRAIATAPRFADHTNP
eukprot:GHVO01029615.1.p2 GENE.GHVO01029615.1~~GHVO01029615.1.p2  ORF type:complete len:109 (-),score=10.44 GHVO01029615.1:573-899(-)